MKLSFKRTLATKLFPRYSETIDRLNWTARWFEDVKQAEVPCFDSREEMYSHLTRGILDKPVDYFEFGVYRGESLRKWCGLNSYPQSRFFGFDSFEGLPEDWRSTQLKGAFSLGGKVPEIADSRIEFVPGWFQNTLPAFLASYRPQNPIVVHNDSDLYSSTLFCLTQMDRLMVRGTIVVFDEFYDVLHEYRALSDYCNAYMRSFRLVAATRRLVQAVVEII